MPLLVAAQAGCGGGGDGGGAPMAVDAEQDFGTVAVGQTDIRPSGPLVDAERDFGAVADGQTDNEPALQAALDHAAAIGGGTVVLQAGTYGIARPLVLRSRVHLAGQGRGRTIVRSLGNTLGKNLPDTDIWAAVAMVGADQASVSALTVDLASAGTHANGIALLPTGKSFEGTPSTNCAVFETEVLGGGNYHAYMIWNLRGRGISIVGNVVDGGIRQPVLGSQQEGIESYGGKDVLIKGNVIRNIGNTALNFGSAGLPDTAVERLVVSDNVVTNAARGLNIGPWIASTGAQNVSDVRIERNQFVRLWQMGLYVGVVDGTWIRGLRIASNRVTSVAGGANSVGIHFNGPPVPSGDPAGENIAVEQNVIEDVRGNNSVGVLVTFFPNVVLEGNTIRRVESVGVQAYGARALKLTGNTISEIGRAGVIAIGPESSIFATGNTLQDWGLTEQYAGIQIDGAIEGEVRSNAFSKSVASGSAVRVEAGAANVIVFGNSLNSPATTTPPFVNIGANSNAAIIAPVAGSTALAIEHAMAAQNGTVNLVQIAGDPLEHSFSVVPGRIELTFKSEPSGAELFYFEVDPAAAPPSVGSNLSGSVHRVGQS